MSKLNGSGNSRRIWRTLPVVSSDLLVPLAQQAEDDGVEGVFEILEAVNLGDDADTTAAKPRASRVLTGTAAPRAEFKRSPPAPRPVSTAGCRNRKKIISPMTSLPV